MKHLKLDVDYTRRGNYYYVFFSRNLTIKHKSKTALKKWLRQVKRLLVDNVRLLNMYQSQVYAMYRTAYFQLSLVESNSIHWNIKESNRKFDFVFNDYGIGSQSAAIHAIRTIISLQIETLLKLKNHANKHKNHVLKNQVQPLLKALFALQEEVMNDMSNLRINKGYQDAEVREMKPTEKESA